MNNSFAFNSIWQNEDFEFTFPGLIAKVPRFHAVDELVVGRALDGNLFAVRGDEEEFFNSDPYQVFIWSANLDAWVNVTYADSNPNDAVNPYLAAAAMTLDNRFNAEMAIREEEEIIRKLDSAVEWDDAKMEFKFKPVETLYTAAWKKPKC